MKCIKKITLIFHVSFIEAFLLGVCLPSVTSRKGVSKKPEGERRGGGGVLVVLKK